MSAHTRRIKAAPSALRRSAVRSALRRSASPVNLPTALVIALAFIVALASCAGTTAAEAPTDEITLPDAGAPADAPPGTAVGGPSVKLAQTSLGKVMVGPDGRTLYAFANDANGASTCTGKCAEAWPPLIVDAGWEPGPELDDGIFATTVRPDGTEQLVAGKWPLYYYAGDSAPGDVGGQGSGDVWFVVDATGALVKTKAGDNPGGSGAGEQSGEGAGKAAPGSGGAVREADSPLGKILVDAEGNTLYGFTKDTEGKPTCAGACANTWPAVIVEDGKLPAGLDPKVFSLVTRTDGKKQLKAGKWPLYRYSGDEGPGDTNGQGSGGVWFVVDGKGGLIKNPAAPEQPGAGGGKPGNAPSAPSTKAPAYRYAYGS
jgi:predicted lipoprotein with Yx(FWY)xxD motif